ncbi:Putative Ribulose-5-phosphate 4-epimerase [Aspergillus calidoustus]|uniref:Putative Ribulose-5-phosphate 4-epimerase n=1 Tax=Aspergillus calidoustus TaxID=454130 RepID=A0A0U5FY04_ASPCI|nr:Putative Ribulose-5-phosphate 4-epimerase [Aspergillus calidoustus]
MSPITVAEDPTCSTTNVSSQSERGPRHVNLEALTATPQSPSSSWHEDVHCISPKDTSNPLRPPTFRTIDLTRTHQKQHLAASFRVLARQGFDEGTAGHISLRDPENPSHFWINPLAKHFSQIRVSDLVLVSEDGIILPGGAQSPINAPAFAIHSAIHRARPDLNAACHAHSVYGKAFSCFGRPIEMLYQDALRFYNDLAVYPRYGGTVLTAEEGERIATALGPKCRSVILQNHGMITCGKTVDEATFLFIALDRCCHAQLLANAAVCPGFEKRVIDDEMAKVGYKRSGNSSKMWLAFQPYYGQVVKEEPDLME